MFAIQIQKTTFGNSLLFNQFYCQNNNNNKNKNKNNYKYKFDKRNLFIFRTLKNERRNFCTEEKNDKNQFIKFKGRIDLSLFFIYLFSII